MQRSLFDDEPAVATVEQVSEQQRQIERVENNIGETVLDFLWIVGTGNTFTMAQLTKHVTAKHPNIAPDSPGRILRNLADKEKRVEYTVERSKSLYTIMMLGE